MIENTFTHEVVEKATFLYIIMKIYRIKRRLVWAQLGEKRSMSKNMVVSDIVSSLLAVDGDGGCCFGSASIFLEIRKNGFFAVIFSLSFVSSPTRKSAAAAIFLFLDSSLLLNSLINCVLMRYQSERKSDVYIGINEEMKKK